MDNPVELTDETEEVHPEDSVSVAQIPGKKSGSVAGKSETPNVSVKTTMSVLRYRYQTKEAELAARSAALKANNELEERKRALQRQLQLAEAEEEILRLRRRQQIQEEQAKIES